MQCVCFASNSAWIRSMRRIRWYTTGIPFSLCTPYSIDSILIRPFSLITVTAKPWINLYILYLYTLVIISPLDSHISTIPRHVHVDRLSSPLYCTGRFPFSVKASGRQTSISPQALKRFSHLTFLHLVFLVFDLTYMSHPSIGTSLSIGTSPSHHCYAIQGGCRDSENLILTVPWFTSYWV